MRNSAEEENPPIPDILGGENASPMKSNDLINENQFSVANHAAHESNSANHNSISSISTSKLEAKSQKCSIGDSILFHWDIYISRSSFKDLSPTEEYLQMMRHLIESNSLSPATTTILQDLYALFKSIKGYGPTTWDRYADFETSTTSRQFDEDKSPSQAETYPSEDATADLKESHSGQEEKPSASDERETLPIDRRGSDKLDHQQTRKSRTTSTDEDRQHQIRFEAEEDYHFGRLCNSDVFKIDNIFSNFSLSEVGHEKALKRHINHMVMKKKKRFPKNSGSTPNGSSQSAAHVEETDSNQNVAKETEIQQEGRLLKILKNRNEDKHDAATKQ